MSHVVEVEIEGKRYIPLLTLKKNATGTLDLTTICNRQSRAVIKIFLCNDSRQLLREIVVSNIPADRAGAPVIMLQGVFAGRNVLTLKVMVNDRLHKRINIRMKNHTRRRNKWLFIIMLLLLGGGIIFSSWLWLSKRKSKELAVAAVSPEAAGQPMTDNGDQDQIIAAKPAEKDESDTTVPLSTGPKAAKAESVKSAASAELADTLKSPPTAKAKPADTVKPAVSAEPPPPIAKVKPAVSAEPPPPIAKVKPAVSAEPPPTAKIKPAATAESPDSGQSDVPTELKKSQELILPENTFYFLPDSSSLTPTAEEKLGILVSLLLGNPELEIEISGHCAPMGNEQGRINLSLERARRVHYFLTASGWKPDIKAKLNGAGSSEAITRNPEKQHLNRRVEIHIISTAD